jgi:glycerol uptake facilitator-like aquaporin
MSTSGMSVNHETVKSVMAEFIGSFLFQFLGGACISNATEHGLGSGAIGNGFAFAIVLYAVTNVSGGHVNPAITAAFRATHRISSTNAIGFICAQIIGSIIGAGFLRLCLPASAPAFITIGTLTDSEPGMTLIWEFLSTFFVVFVVYAVTFNKDFRPIGPFAIGVRNFMIFLRCLTDAICSSQSLLPHSLLVPLLAPPSILLAPSLLRLSLAPFTRY